MSRTNVKSYFEGHAHNYANRHTEFYSSIMNQIKNIIMTKTTIITLNFWMLDVVMEVLLKPWLKQA